MSRNHSSEDGTDSCFYLSEVSPKDKPWDKHRVQADAVSKLYAEADLSIYSNRIDSCSQWLEFALKVSETGEVNPKLYSAWFCRVRHCPICQWRRSLMWRARLFQVLPKLLTDYPTSRFIFLTLTVRNCPVEELRSTLKDMTEGWKRMSLRKSFPATGFIRSVEVTRNPVTGLSHPHFHALLMVKPRYFKDQDYIPTLGWRSLWQSCLKVDYLPVVNVKAVKAKSTDSTGNTEADLFKAICETLKYTVKGDDLTFDSAWLEELTKQLHRTRAVTLGGIFKEYLSVDEPEDLIHTDLDGEEITEKDMKLIFNWEELIKRYVKRK